MIANKLVIASLLAGIYRAEGETSGATTVAAKSPFTAVTLDVSKKEAGSNGKGEFKKVGEMTVYVPTLADIAGFVAGAKQAIDEKTKQPTFEDGLPIYESEEANYVQSAIFAAVKAQARNKLVSGTANLKPDLKIAETWAELCAEGSRGDGAHLKLAAELRKAFSDWVAKQGLSEGAAATLTSLFANKTALQLQTQANKDKVAARVTAFAGDLPEADLERFQRPLQNVIDACASVTDAMDF